MTKRDFVREYVEGYHQTYPVHFATPKGTRKANVEGPACGNCGVAMKPRVAARYSRVEKPVQWMCIQVPCRWGRKLQ